MKPFDIEAARRGEPVVTRGGRDVEQVSLMETSNGITVVGVVGGIFKFWSGEGTRFGQGDWETPYDLFMKTNTVTVGVQEVPAPMYHVNEGDSVYILHADGYVEHMTFEGTPEDWDYRNNGSLFESEAAAEAVRNARSQLAKGAVQ